MELPQNAQSCISLVKDLSVLVISHPGKWRDTQFKPSKLSVRKIDWFEGTGTVIGIKRNRVFILSSIHCEPSSSYSYFVKGEITRQEQVAVTLSVNRFVEENNGIDIALFSCDSSSFNEEVLRRMTHCLRWDFSPVAMSPGASLHLVHFPTVEDEHDLTRRLHQPVFPDVSAGYLLSVDSEAECFDSTVVATAGSSGGLVISEQGVVVGSHDSQHNDTSDGNPVWTHRLSVSIRDALSSMRGVMDMFPPHTPC